MSRRPVLAYLQVSLAAIGWGTWALFLRPAKVDPRWASALMLGVVSIVTAPLLLRAGGRRAPGASSQGEDHGERRPRDWLAVLALGVSDAGNATLFFAALGVTSVAIAVLSHYLAPVLVALAAPSVLGTRRSPRAVVLTVVALFGLALVLEPWKLSDAGGGRPILGALLGAGSAAFYATNVLITKRVSDRFTSEELLVYHSVISCLLVTGLALAAGAPFPASAGVWRVVLGSLGPGAIGGLIFLYGLRRLPAEHAGILTFLEPLTAVLVAWIAFSERPGAAAAVGGALVIAAGLRAIRSSATPTA